MMPTTPSMSIEPSHPGEYVGSTDAARGVGMQGSGSRF
jgi:hypothetical protein